MTIDSPIITGSIQSPLNLTGNISASGAITGSGFFTSGNIVANTLIVQVVSSSVDYITGSTKFGTIDSNTHQFTGSLYISGSNISVGSNFNYTNSQFLQIIKSEGASYVASSATSNIKLTTRSLIVPKYWSSSCCPFGDGGRHFHEILIPCRSQVHFISHDRPPPSK